MHKTKEIRWFFEPNNKNLSYWFDNLSFNTKNEVTESFLLTPQEGEIIKVDNEQITIQRQDGPRAEGCINANIWGHFDTFLNWKFDLNSNSRDLKTVFETPNSYWIPISLCRQRAFYTEVHGDVVIQAQASEGTEGCYIEYASFNFSNESWYTLSIQWHGAETQNLNPEFVIKLLGDTTLSMKQSKNFPTFLKNLM